MSSKQEEQLWFLPGALYVEHSEKSAQECTRSAALLVSALLLGVPLEEARDVVGALIFIEALAGVPSGARRTLETLSPNTLLDDVV